MKLLNKGRGRAAVDSGAHGCSVLAAGLTVVGDIETEGTIRIDGRLEGSIRRAGSVIIGVDAMVQGNISAREVVVGGTVQGNIDAVDRVELQTTSVVTGDVEANAVLIQEGGTLRGRMCVRSRDGQSLPAAQPAQPAQPAQSRPPAMTTPAATAAVSGAR
jgi:cytoskeletal protein CcmA (bactofilin family)